MDLHFWGVSIIDLGDFGSIAAITNQMTIRLVNIIDVEFLKVRS